MSRFAIIAAPLALTFLTSTQTLAATSTSPVYTPPAPTHVKGVCFWRAWVGHWSPLYTRQCDPGEKPFTVKDIVPGGPY